MTFEQLEHVMFRLLTPCPDDRECYLMHRECVSEILLAGWDEGYRAGFLAGERKGESETLRRISEAEIRHNKV